MLTEIAGCAGSTCTPGWRSVRFGLPESTDSGQGPYVLAATASGTQLNLSLLKAFNFPEELPLHACFYLDFIPGNPPTFSLRVQKVEFTDGLNE